MSWTSLKRAPQGGSSVQKATSRWSVCISLSGRLIGRRGCGAVSNTSITCRLSARAKRVSADAKDAGVPYSYFNPSATKVGLWPALGSPNLRPVSLVNPPEISPTPMQVIRRHAIHYTAMDMNHIYWALPGIKGTIWEHYMLVAAQWPTVALPVAPYSDGVYFPETPSRKLRELDDGDVLAGSTFKLHVLPSSLQLTRARLRCHAWKFPLRAIRIAPSLRENRPADWRCCAFLSDQAGIV